MFRSGYRERGEIPGKQKKFFQKSENERRIFRKRVENNKIEAFCERMTR